MQVIEKPTEIKLDRHAVIEASAGTGKTYTITHLVLRLLLEKQLTISQILLVTFTDKATSELKARIHEGIGDKLTEQGLSSAEKRLLEHALRDLHLASIHTIHGFCQRVLKEYAFEQGSVLDKSLVDDSTVFIKQLQMLKRTWPAIEGISEKLSNTELSTQQLDDLLIDLAKKVKPGDVIYPESAEMALLKANQQMEQFNTTALEDIEADFKSLEGLSAKVLENRWRDKLMFVVNEINALKESGLILEQLIAVFPMLKKTAKAVINTSDIKKQPALKKLAGAPLFKAYFDQLKLLLNQFEVAIIAENYQFVIAMVEALQQRVKQHKVSQGQISYDDMIGDLAAALKVESGSENQALTNRLRDKYRVALIDEFQDTDAQQWSIFQHVFTAHKGEHQLVLIGDPKQSIYGFRGANIYTYEEAKSYLMTNAQQGLGYRLSTNFRSLPALTDKLNQFFTYQSEQQTSWYESEEVMVFSPPKSKQEEAGGPLLLADDSGLSELNSITVVEEGLLVDGLKQQISIQIGRVIQQQLMGQMSFKRKGSEKTLDAGDICILVRNKKDAKPIEHVLDRLQIPHSFYKKTDLYQSEAAIQIQLVLTALAFPNMKKQVNNAWLSLFFEINTAQIRHLSQQQGLINDDEALSQFLSIWLKLKSLSKQQDWVALFNVLFEETGAVKRLYATGKWRMLANLQQIKQELLKVSLDQQLDAHGMLHLLLSSRSSQLISKEDWQQKDTEIPAVQIMTIHSSKGLEFPVVFLFGGFSAPAHNHKFCKYYDSSITAQVFNLVDNQTKLYLAEVEAENKRLYYVAMTRAIFKLIVPVYNESIYQAHNNAYVFYQNQVVARLLESGMANPIKQLTQDSVLASEEQKPLIKKIPLLNISEDLVNKSRIIHSFSSLQRYRTEDKTHFGNSPQMDLAQADDVKTEPVSTIDQIPSIPGGAQTGNVLHGIFENLDFNLVSEHKNLNEFQKDQSVMSVIENQMKVFLMNDGDILDDAGVLRSSYSKEFAAWVWHTLRKPINAIGGRQLCELEDADRRHEMSFYWSQSGHVLTGFIDLLFKLKGPAGDEYFILDWKSNFNAGGYAPDSLADQVMKAHNYHDQYRWYTLAIKAWFNSLRLKNAKLVGSLYLFSRGIDSISGNQDGVFYEDLTTDEYSLTHLETQLIKNIQSIGDEQKGLL